MFDDNIDRMDQEERTLILSMISIFNVALTTHNTLLRGKMGGKNCRKTTTLIRMETSLKLYECANFLLIQVDKKQRTNNSSLLFIWRRILMFSILYMAWDPFTENSKTRESRLNVSTVSLFRLLVSRIKVLVSKRVIFLHISILMQSYMMFPNTQK